MWAGRSASAGYWRSTAGAVVAVLHYCTATTAVLLLALGLAGDLGNLRFRWYGQ